MLLTASSIDECREITHVELSKQIDKLLVRVNLLLDAVAREHKKGLISKGVNRYYYIQKREELTLLKEAALSAIENNTVPDDRQRFLMEKLDAEYREVYTMWKKDVRWIHNLRQEKTRDTSTSTSAAAWRIL